MTVLYLVHTICKFSYIYLYLYIYYTYIYLLRRQYQKKFSQHSFTRLVCGYNVYRYYLHVYANLLPYVNVLL